MSFLFSSTYLGALELQNRLVMCPLTRSRAIDNVPNAMIDPDLFNQVESGVRRD